MIPAIPAPATTRLRRHGFSLIELAIISFLCMTLVLLVVGLVGRSRDVARTIGCINNIRQLSAAIEAYRADWREPPDTPAALFPLYLSSVNTFSCPAAPGSEGSYDACYVARGDSDEDADKIFLVCNRHARGRRAVAANLSYAITTANLQPFTWAGLPGSFNSSYTGGSLRLADGTRIDILEGSVGVLSSFRDRDGRIVSLLYVPDRRGGEAGTTRLEIDHRGDSRLEIVDPCIITGVSGTRLRVQTSWGATTLVSSAWVMEGAVLVTTRTGPSRVALRQGEGVLTVDANRPAVAAGSLRRNPPRPVRIRTLRKHADQVL